jgi:hypothetical protein
METSPVIVEQQEETEGSVRVPLRSLRPKMQVEGIVTAVTPPALSLTSAPRSLALSISPSWPLNRFYGFPMC